MSSASAYERISLDAFTENFSSTTELSSVALGGTVKSVSDEFFAEAFHLLLVEPAPSLKGQFGPKGALYSGWETRRHNPDYDWCIIKLGTTGFVTGFDLDTSHFNGNEAPEVTVHALFSTDDASISVDDSRWSEILPRVALGPNSRHLFKTPPTASVNYIKLSMYPDGGIARFRVYGDVSPVRPQNLETVYDLAHVFAGGHVVYTSDQHFGVGSNLILPGRGKDMGDGWETKRSRQQGHKDWAIIKLGDAGFLSHTEIDTAHFKGNFPESCELHAVNTNIVRPSELPEDAWSLILPRIKLGPHRQHQFQLENVDKPYTHVRITIHPDGGLKRVRLFGRRAPAPTGEAHQDTTVQRVVDEHTESRSQHATAQLPILPAIPALALTPEAFAPFGQVVQAYPDVNAVPSPRSTKITGANQGTATKYHKLAPLVSSYPAHVGATAGLSVYHCKPIPLESGGIWPVKLLERHPCTNQAFIPMGSGTAIEFEGDTGKETTGQGRYLVIVALTTEDDKPDLKSLRAFVASANQGIVYNTGVWHHPMAVVEGPMDFTCVETQAGNGDPLDCEIFNLDTTVGLPAVSVPAGK
ncbi:Allantoicase [Steccherinum ochraceum]|uniref:Allantoicase n=1 Tax=Steccherinum ochraceum TaxID=92696 RepID=A0A4R0S287_9APHY|nr:Allantoicase [Steccherinum ochraceum]